MTPLLKAMAKFGPPRNETYYIYYSKGIDESCPKMCPLLNLSHCVKSYAHFCQILVLFTMPAQQIWSCHVIQDANFENLNFLFCPNSTFNIRKSRQISSEKALYFGSYQQKALRGGGCICLCYVIGSQMNGVCVGGEGGGGRGALNYLHVLFCKVCTISAILTNFHVSIAQDLN